MGVIVSSDNREVWEPSLAVGYLFVDQLHSLERLIGLESGVSPVTSDEVTIDSIRFEAFIRGCLRKLEETDHRALVVLVAGCLQLAIAVNHRITGEWPTVPERHRFLVDNARAALDPGWDSSISEGPRTPSLVVGAAKGE